MRRQSVKEKMIRVRTRADTGDGGIGLPAAQWAGRNAALAETLVRCLGGRYSSELGIDVDAGDAEIERWFLASALFGTRIRASVAERTFRVLSHAGIHRITDAERRTWDELVALLDSGGYARYDFRTATRLQALARRVLERHSGDVAAIGRQVVDPKKLVATLEELPGFGPVTIALFLRELRGVWPGARMALDARAAEAARHLGLIGGRGHDDLAQIERLAQKSGCDVRDLEAALVRLALVHRRRLPCPGGTRCIVLHPGAPTPKRVK
jgi:endonuclease III